LSDIADRKRRSVRSSGELAAGAEIARPDACHSSSTMSWLLNSARGKCRRSGAISSNSASPLRTLGTDAPGLAMTRSIAWSSSSKMEMFELFMVASHFAAQRLESAKLELLDGPFASAQFLGDLAHRFLVHKAEQDHQALVGGQFFHQLVQHGAALSVG